MAKEIESVERKNSIDLNFSENNKESKEIVESNALYPKLDDTNVVSSSKLATMLTNSQQIQPSPSQACVYQQTTVSYSRNGHSRNPSSINGITIATQVIQPPLSKPDAIDNLLKLIRFRSDYEDNNEAMRNQQICGIRETRLISKSKIRM